MRSWTRISNLSVFGAPVFLHWSVLVVVGALALLGLSSPIYAFLSIASYLAIIALHEIGHAYVARRFGCRVEAIRVAILHGWCEYEAPYYEWEDVLISWGGVAAQICVAVPVLLIAALLGDRELPYLGPIIVFLGYVNLLIAIINLAPAQGCDGKKAWRAIPLLFHQWRARKATKRTLRSVSKRK
jgi:Zn-dependent protease